MSSWDSNDSKYIYNKHGRKSNRVGQAVLDIKSKEQPSYTVGEILDASAEEFVKSMEKAVQDGLEKFKSTFYVLVLTNKEFWTDNVVRNRMVTRQTAPYASEMMIAYPNFSKTLYAVNASKGEVKVAWSLPGWQDCKLVAKNPHLYDQTLVGWIRQCGEGKLDIDNYDYLFR